MGLDRCRFKKSELVQRLLCCVCDAVLLSPVQCALCKKCLCKGCVGRAQQSQCLHLEILPVSKFLTMKLEMMELRCRFQMHGCAAWCTVKDLFRHESTCTFACGTSFDLKENSAPPDPKPHCSDCKTKMILCHSGCGKLMTPSEAQKHDCFSDLLAETRKKAKANATLLAKLDAAVQEKNRVGLMIADFSQESVAMIRQCECRLVEIEAEKVRVREMYEQRVEAAEEHCEGEVGGYIRQQVASLSQLSPDLDSSMTSLQSKYDDLFSSLTKRQRDSLRFCTTKTSADTFSFCECRPKPPKFVSQFRPKTATSRSQSGARTK